MNNKGFTLIEIIMVIAILALLAILTTPNVISLINKNKVDDYNAVIDSIVKATDIYVSDNRYDLTFDNSCSDSVDEISTNISLSKLVASGDLSSEITNHCTNEIIYNDNLKNILVTITLDCKTKKFSYEVDIAENYFKRKPNVTDSSGKILEGKYCTDLISEVSNE